MRRLNKILLLFMALLLVSLAGIWQFMQTETFGNNLSRSINRFTTAQWGVSVSFESLDFQFFPPGANINRVTARVERPETKANLSVGKLGVYFNMMDSFKTQLTIREFYFEDAHIEISEYPAAQPGSKKTKKLNFADTAQSFQQAIPFNIQKALFRDVLVDVKGNTHLVNMASLSIEEQGIRASAELRSIDLAQYGSLDQRLDQIAFEAVLFNDRLEIEKLEVYQGVNSATARGVARDPFGKPSIDLKGSFSAEISEVGKYLPLESIGELRKGVARGTFGVKGNLESYTGKASVVVTNFDTDFINGDKLEAQVGLDNEKITVASLRLDAGNQRIELKEPTELFTFGNKKFTRQPFVLIARKAKLSNILRYLRDTLQPLDAELSGEVSIAFGNDSVRFFSTEKPALENLAVNIGQTRILGANRIVLEQPDFAIVNGQFSMATAANMGRTQLKVVGGVDDGELDFSARQAQVDLSQLGPFAGLDVTGRGTVDLQVKGKGEQTKIELDVELEQFAFEGFQMEEAKAKVVFDFARSEIIISDVAGAQGRAAVEGEAVINYDTLDVEANGRLVATRYSDVKAILVPLLGELEAIPEELYGAWTFSFDVGGKATLDDLEVKGAFSGRNNYVYSEGFEFLGFELGFKNKKLQLKDILAKKAGGALKGEFDFYVEDSSMRYRVNADKIPLSEITYYSRTPFAFDGLFSGSLLGEQRGDRQNILVDLRVAETGLGGETYPDSGLSIALTNNELAYNINFLGSEAVLQGRLILNESDEKSLMKLSINSRDFKRPLGLLRFVDAPSLRMDGRMRMEANAEFDGLNYHNGSLRVNLEELVIEKDHVQLEYRNRGAEQIVVEAGEIKKWNLGLEGKGAYLTSRGSGNLDGNYDVETRFKIDAEILEIFNTVVSRAQGALRIRTRFFSDGKDEDYEVAALGDDITLNSELLPTPLSGLGFKVSYRDKRILLEDVKARLAVGQAFASGSVGLRGLFPDFDLRLKLQEAGFPIMGKTNLAVNGNFHLSGASPPYSLAGEVSVQRLTIMNELTELRGGGGVSLKKDYDYLPEFASATTNNYLRMNIGIETVEPILLNNSLADIGMVGNAQVIGGEEDFRVVGRFSLAPRNNKVIFKSSEYILTKANIFFYERNKVTNPELDIAAYSVINDHRINIKVYGPVEDYKLELSSEPSLAQEDVLSLIAFGYTGDLSSNLSEREKESMTRAGVGSIIFDSFKINETLKNEFGLQVNLGTEIEEENRSYLERVNSDSSLNRVNSATTIEIKKQLNEAMDLSVTSTVGGSIGQRQSMNLNYNLNNNLSVEGVYETRTSDEGEETINDSSLGADVKIRWSFR